MVLTRQAFWLAGIVFILAIHDALTTYIIIFNGGIENNFILWHVMNLLGVKMGLFVVAPVIKLVGVVYVVSALARVEKKYSSRDWFARTLYIVIIIAVIVCAGPVVHNYYIIFFK